MPKTPNPKFFKTQEAFRKWLDQNHTTGVEILVGYYKVATGLPSITWPESVDVALAFGWIDGIRKSIDDESYTVRFTPRKPNSIWSARNIKRIEELTASGLMMPAGVKAYECRKESLSRIYSHENEPKSLSKAYEKQFRARKGAWEFFSRQAPSYIRVMTWWVMSAKQEVTRIKRLTILIDASAEGVKLSTFQPTKRRV